MTETERFAQAARLREEAALSTDPEERGRLEDAAAELEGTSLTGAANFRAAPSDDPRTV